MMQSDTGCLLTLGLSGCVNLKSISCSL